ncbi:putative membrane protein, required for colicin V production [Beggiatoa alba B18LD]|uniref:Putative membrane protein, required for colicin V production n=1 Tax=Beggiatoa alba B18LD TaxID=395493 RepID=I3CBU5_9GAMM|nr:CvpA family protein [Beggiatoa alba]EIJ41088.1 putative membrane protein, required for colicin V production [Beggiatoa alba B18LD]
MNWADTTILAVFFFSTIIGLVQGFIKEVLSLLAWLIAMAIAISFLSIFDEILYKSIPYSDLRLGIAFSGILLVSLALLHWMNDLIIQSVGEIPPTFFEHFLGSLLGLARANVVILAFVLLAGLTQIPHWNSWQQSVLIPFFQTTALILRNQLPISIASQFNFEPLSAYRPYVP